MSLLVDWDAFHLAEVLLTQPLLVVIGDKPGGFGAYRDGHEIYGRAASSDKELLVLPNTSHYELYDQPDATAKALDRVGSVSREACACMTNGRLARL